MRPRRKPTKLRSVPYTSAQVAGDTNILVIGWNNATSNITSVTDSAGNVYQLAVPTARGSGISQAIYYAKNIKAAAAGANTVTVTFNTATPYVDLRPLNTAVSISSIRSMSAPRRPEPGNGEQRRGHHHRGPRTRLWCRHHDRWLLGGRYDFTTRIITSPDLDIAEDRFVTATGSYSATASPGPRHG